MHIFPDATWMVLTECIMLRKSAMTGMQATYHPLDAVTDAETYRTMKQQLKRTHQQVEAINMVDISPSTFIQDQRLRLTEVHDVIKTKAYKSKDVEEDGDNNEPHGFWDAHEEVPTTMMDIIRMLLFDTTNGCTITEHETKEEKETPISKEKETELFYFDCTSPTPRFTSQHGMDWLDIEGLCSIKSDIDCVFETAQTTMSREDIPKGDPWLQANAAPTLQGCNSMTIDTLFQGPGAFM